MREELSKYQSSQPCEVCHGARLKPEALAVKVAMKDISYATHLSVVDALAWFQDLPRHLGAPAKGNRRAHPQGNPRAARLPQQCRPRLPQPRPHLRHAIRRREPAHPPRLADRQRAVGRALRPRRARRSACTSATTTCCSRRCGGCATSATPCWWSSMTRTRSAPPITSSTWGPARAMHGGEIVAHGTLDQVLAHKDSITADYLNGTREVPVPLLRRKGNGKKLTVEQRHRQQSARRHREHPARHLHLHHRRVGQRQVELHDRHALRQPRRGN